MAESPDYRIQFRVTQDQKDAADAATDAFYLYVENALFLAGLLTGPVLEAIQLGRAAYIDDLGHY